jgi:hypothetical protein
VESRLARTYLGLFSISALSHWTRKATRIYPHTYMSKTKSFGKNAKLELRYLTRRKLKIPAVLHEDLVSAASAPTPKQSIALNTMRKQVGSQLDMSNVARWTTWNQKKVRRRMMSRVRFLEISTQKTSRLFRSSFE